MPYVGTVQWRTVWYKLGLPGFLTSSIFSYSENNMTFLELDLFLFSGGRVWRTVFSSCVLFLSPDGGTFSSWKVDVSFGTRWWTKSNNLIIVCPLYYRQNPLELAYVLIFRYFLKFLCMQILKKLHYYSVTSALLFWCNAWFWPMEFSNGRLGANHYCSDSVVFPLAILSAFVSSVGFVTVKFQANKHTPLAN